MSLGAKHNPQIPPESGQRRRLAASGYGAPVAVALICLGVFALGYNHNRGNFHKLKDVVNPQHQVANTVVSGPGGQGVIDLTRSATSAGAYPQFISMQLLPGRGLDVLQITANVPGHGDVPLLLSHTLDEASLLLADQGPAMHNGTSFGAAFLAPWAGRLSGSATDNPGVLHSLWNGHWTAFPAESEGSNLSVEGLLLGRSADLVKTSLLPDGESADALFHAGSFGDSWPSQLDVTTHVDLSGQVIELTITASNVGPAPTPVGLGWRPFFRIASGDRANALLSIPSSSRAMIDPRTGLPTGKIESISGTPLDFGHASGTALGSQNLDVSYSGLRSGATSGGPSIELQDPAYGYGLRLTPVGETVSTVHVTAPTDQPWVALEAGTNQGDPLGHQWVNTADNSNASGIKILDPGQSLTLHLRVEIFPIVRTSVIPETKP